MARCYGQVAPDTLSFPEIRDRQTRSIRHHKSLDPKCDANLVQGFLTHAMQRRIGSLLPRTFTH